MTSSSDSEHSRSTTPDVPVKRRCASIGPTHSSEESPVYISPSDSQKPTPSPSSAPATSEYDSDVPLEPQSSF